MKTFRHRRSQGMTLTEVMIASGISVVVSVGIMTLFTLVSTFTRQGFAETRQFNQTTIAIETMSRILNHAYRADASPASLGYTIANDNQSIQFTVPTDDPGVNEVRRFRFDPDADTLHYEIQAAGGGQFSEAGGTELLDDVDDFFIANQEGILSFVISVYVDMGVSGEKRYTMVGRALPRNI
jgi:type II secretory pathway component PulJ